MPSSPSARLVRVKAHPGAREDRLERLPSPAGGPAAYEAWVRAPAERGRANEAILVLDPIPEGTIRAAARTL